VHAAVPSLFKSLERLSIHLRCKDNDVNFRPAVDVFFDCLGPLTTLRLYGSVDVSLVYRILERRGFMLRELVLRPSEPVHYGSHELAMILTKADILQIRDRCPLLEDLNVSVKRSKSDWRETKCHEVLGTFASLTMLGIHLDCFNPRVPSTPDADSDVFDRRSYISHGNGLYNAHIEDAFINSAVDEALARSILDIVSANKPGRSLAYLRITSGGGSSFGGMIPGGLSRRVDHISQSFLLTRSERDDNDDIEVIELGKRVREERDARGRHQEAEMLKKWGHTGDARLNSIFERLWPPKPGSRDWRDDWSSKPLQRS
jgi:hypothetical protein